MTEKELEEIKQKYGFTLRPSAFNGKPIKYVSKEEYEEKIHKIWNQMFEVAWTMMIQMRRIFNGKFCTNVIERIWHIEI